MSDLAERHRQIADILEPLERMGIDATVDERTTDDGTLRLTLTLGLPPDLDPIGQKATDPTGALEARIRELEKQSEPSESDHETDPDPSEDGYPSVGGEKLTDGERETLDALRTLGGPRASGDIADQVDATIQSVRSWLPKLAGAGLIETVPDPTDGRRELYSPVVSEESATDEGSADEDDTIDRSEDNPVDRSQDNTVEETTDVAGTVYVATGGGSPSQVFHVRPDCPQLRRAEDFVEKDRSVVPHHRPCGTCVSTDLADGLVAISNSPTETYHKRADCPRLASATDVTVVAGETVPDFDPCADCVSGDRTSDRDEDEKERDGDTDEDGSDEEEADADDVSMAAELCDRNDLDREAVIEALDAATAIYHVQRDLTLPRDETETLLRDLGVFETLDGGGHVSLDRAKSVVHEHVPPT